MRSGGLWLLLLLAVLSLASCKQVQYVPVETVRLDSIYLTQIQRDSIYKYDSIYVRDKGDTVFVDRYKYMFVDKLKRDTMYLSRIDTIRIPYPVEKKLSRWEQLRLDVGGYAICTVIVMILVIVGYMVYKLKKG